MVAWRLRGPGGWHRKVWSQIANFVLPPIGFRLNFDVGIRVIIGKDFV